MIQLTGLGTTFFITLLFSIRIQNIVNGVLSLFYKFKSSRFLFLLGTLVMYWLVQYNEINTLEIPLHHDAARLNGQDYLEAMKHQNTFVWNVHLFNSSQQTWYVNYSHWGGKKCKHISGASCQALWDQKNYPQSRGKLKAWSSASCCSQKLASLVVQYSFSI